jgi:hypothetical protein
MSSIFTLHYHLVCLQYLHYITTLYVFNIYITLHYISVIREPESNNIV